MKYLLIILGLSLSVQLHALTDSVKVLNKARDLQQKIERLESKKSTAGGFAAISGGVAATCIAPLTQDVYLYDSSFESLLAAAGIMAGMSLVQGIRYLSFSSILLVKRKELDRLMKDYKLYVDSKGIIQYPT